MTAPLISQFSEDHLRMRPENVNPYVLVATGLCRTYRDLTVLDLDEIVITPGARHAIIGPNGAGKSTLLNLLAGTDRPTAGTISYNGETITRRGAAWRARHGIGYTFQRPAAFPDLTCMENLLVGGWHRRHNRERSPDELLELVGLAGSANQAAGTLSHGHRRMLDLAIALAGQPRLLLLDEPAAGLTDEGVTRLLNILTALPDSISLILVEHDMTVVAALTTWITVLHHGRRYASGPATQVRADPAVAELYLGTTGGR